MHIKKEQTLLHELLQCEKKTRIEERKEEKQKKPEEKRKEEK